MLLWVSGALCIGAAGIAARWWGRRSDALGRPRSFPLFSVAALVLLGGAALAPWLLRARLEHRLAGAVSTIVGSSVDVHCKPQAKRSPMPAETSAMWRLDRTVCLRGGRR